MEIAAGDDLVLLRKDQGIVGNGVDLPAYRVPHIADGVPAGPVDLGGAANGVGILDLVRIQGEGQPAALQQAAQVLRRGDLPRLPPQGVYLGVKGLPDAVQGLAGHGGGDVRRFGQVPGVIHRLTGDGRHDLGAVDKGQTLLGGQLDGLDAGGSHSLPARQHPALILCLSLAQHHQHHVGQGGQVAAGAQGALLRDNGMDAPVQHSQQRLHGGQTNAGIAPGQGVQPQQHRRPHHPGGQRPAHAAGVGNDKVSLQLGGLLLRHEHRGEFAEPRGQAVYHGLFRQLPVHIGPGGVDALHRLRGDGHRLPFPGDGDDLFNGQVVSVDINHGVSSCCSVTPTSRPFFITVCTRLLPKR